ncbi:hypothetical protein BC629DRAFT_1594186 [Irpex lacteus]|nr:hypothetical protein BC629DRAFT_1594186 [Irpex lacteus]
MYPCYGDCWLIGAPPELEYDHVDDDYDEYLFWPSSQVLVPADAWYPEEFDPVSPLNLRSNLDDELDELDLGSSQLLNFEPTYSFDSNFVFPANQYAEADTYGYSRLFRTGLVAKAIDWSGLYSSS